MKTSLANRINRNSILYLSILFLSTMMFMTSESFTQNNCGFNEEGCGQWSNTIVEYFHPPTHPECYVTIQYKYRYCLVNGKYVLQFQLEYFHFLDPFNNCSNYYNYLTNGGGQLFDQTKLKIMLEQIQEEMAKLEFLKKFEENEGTPFEYQYRCPSSTNYTCQFIRAACSKTCTSLVPEMIGGGQTIYKRYLKIAKCGTACFTENYAMCIDENNQVVITKSILPPDNMNDCYTPTEDCNFPPNSTEIYESACFPILD